MIIGIDFDGTCVTHDFPRIGKDIGAVPVLKELIENNHQLILFTMRSDDSLKEAEQWFEENGIPLYGVQTNPTQKKWTNSPKAYCQLYIDDAALGCPLRNDESLSNRPFVYWERVQKMLVAKGILPWKM